MRAAWKALVLGAAVLAARPAGAATKDNEPPEITPDPVKPPAPGKAVVVECDITDKSGVFEPQVYWKPVGAKDFALAPLKPNGGTRFRAYLPVPGNVKEIEYFIEAFDENGNGPARVGNDKKPLRAVLVQAAPPPPPVTKKDPAKAAPVADGPPVPAIATLAVGGVALAASGVFGFLAQGDYSDFKATRDPVKRPQLAASVKTESLVADVSLGVGLVAAGVGTWLLLSGPSAAAPEKAEEKGHFVFLPVPGGLSVQGAF